MAYGIVEKPPGNTISIITIFDLIRSKKTDFIGLDIGELCDHKKPWDCQGAAAPWLSFGSGGLRAETDESRRISFLTELAARETAGREAKCCDPAKSEVFRRYEEGGAATNLTF